MINEKTQAIVNILNHNGEGIGTGFFIDTKRFLTCYHVVKSCVEQVKYKKYNGSCFYAHVVKIDESCDSAICETEDESDVFFDVEKEIAELNESENYYTYGFISRQGSEIKETIKYSNVTTTDGLKVFLMKDANNLYNGISGAPLWNNDGHVVGMIKGIGGGPLHGTCYAIRSKEMADLLSNRPNKEKTEFDRVINFFPENRYMYDNIVNKLRIDMPRLFLGDGISEFVTGGKIKFIDYICDTVISELQDYDPKDKKSFLKGELGLSIEKFPNDFIRFTLKDELNNYLSKEVDGAKFEFQVAFYVACFNTYIRLLPDQLIKYIVDRFDLPHDWIYPNSKLVSSIENVTYTYTMCWSEDKEQETIYLYKDFNEKVMPHFKQWNGRKSILYVGIDFDEKELELVQNIGADNTNYAFVPCNDDDDKKREMSGELKKSNIMPVFFNCASPSDLDVIMHKLVVDTANKNFERFYDMLDFRYSAHTLIGQSNNMRWLAEFLSSSDEKILWTVVFGEINCGKSRLMYDFMRKNQSTWECYFVHYASINAFFEDVERHKRLNRDTLIIFDDFYLNDDRTQKFEQLFTNYSSRNYKLRLIFVSRTDDDLFDDADGLVKKSIERSKYEKGILCIESLHKDEIISLCCSYAEYLQRRANKSNEDMRRIISNIKDVIGELYDQRCNSDPMILNNCLSKTLELLGLLPPHKTFEQYSMQCLEHPSIMNGNDGIIFKKYESVFERMDFNEKTQKNRKNRMITSNQYEKFINDDRGA